MELGGNMEPKILVADDDKVLLDLMLRRIRRMGYQADRAENGSYAMEMIHNANYDLVITDIYMPGATGLDVLRQAQKVDPGTVVLIVTGGATIEKALEALDHGAYLYLTKPFDHLMVFDFIVKRALEYRRLTNGFGGDFPGKDYPSIVHVPDSGSPLILTCTQLFDIVDVLPAGVVLCDPGGKMLFCNPSAEAFMNEYWGSVEQAINELESAKEVTKVNGRSSIMDLGRLRIRAENIPMDSSNVFTLYAMDELIDIPNGNFEGIERPIEYLKKALAWMFNQKMTPREFLVIRSMANQVAAIDQILECSGRTMQESM
jgi:CheY-like chemotaxis protein